MVKHLPMEIQPVIRFAAITGWRIASEVLPLEWRQVDLDANEVRLDPGTTKNREGRVFKLTTELRNLLLARQAARDRVKKAGHIMPRVLPRSGRGTRRTEETAADHRIRHGMEGRVRGYRVPWPNPA